MYILGAEKKAGILKPQGSLEKSREERELMSNSSNPADAVPSVTVVTATNNKSETMKNKRGKQNVALQSIFKKMEENNKQVGNESFFLDFFSDCKVKVTLLFSLFHIFIYRMFRIQDILNIVYMKI